MSETETDERPARRSPFLLILSAVVSLVVLGGALAAPLVARVAGYEGAPLDLS